NTTVFREDDEQHAAAADLLCYSRDEGDEVKVKVGVVEVGDSETRPRLRADAEFWGGTESTKWVMTVKVLANYRIQFDYYYTRDQYSTRTREVREVLHHAATAWVEPEDRRSNESFRVIGDSFQVPLAAKVQ
ncbi:hypothetical protein KEM55_006850, partial [Ascosphaera atra]